MSPTGEDSSRTVLEAADIGRAVTRIATEILERNKGLHNLVLLGIPTRGVDLARRLGRRLEEIAAQDPDTDGGGTRVAVGSLDVTMYRDDLHLRPGRGIGPTEVPLSGVDGAVVLLVDDVLYSGRTIRAALDALHDVGRPRAVQLAVLVDRGHHDYPIRADYVGRHVPTAEDETVDVLLAERDGRDAVLLGARTPVHSGGGAS